MAYETIIWEQSGAVGRLTLNRPHSLNAWTPQFGQELRTIIERDAADESVRAVLITGAGRGFSSGADMKAGFEPAEDGMPDIGRELLEWCRTYVARFQGRPIAAIMVARFDGRAYYLFGGSNGDAREVMPAYVLQWTAMQEAFAAGCRDYDLWGVPPRPDPAHPWAGLWQFKTGFGGRMVELCGAWDLAVSPLLAGLGEAPQRLGRSLRRALAARS